MTRQIPDELRSRPFTTRQAQAYGVGAQVLKGPSVVRLFRGVHAHTGLPLTSTTWLRAELLVLPLDAAVSHTTALRLYGIDLGPLRPLHFSTNTAHKVTHPGVRLHRRRGRLSPQSVQGFSTLGPDRTMADAATLLGFVRLVQAGDALVHRGHTTVEAMRSYLATSHIDGVVRARRATAYVRERVESPMETFVRLMIMFARLPEPGSNLDILDANGRFVASGDMPHFDYQVLVEYDGEWHERSRQQRGRDRDRRAHLENLGWTVVVVLVEDLKNTRSIVLRVYQALRRRWYAGPPPHMNAMWTRWFAGREGYQEPPKAASVLASIASQRVSTSSRSTCAIARTVNGTR